MKLTKLAILILLAGVLNVHAYVVKYNGSGLVRRWSLLSPHSGVSTNVVNTDLHVVRYFLASDGYSPGNTAAELDAVRASFAQWQSVPGTYLKFEDAGLIDPPVDVNTSDNMNIVYWAKDSTTNINGGHDNITGILGLTIVSFDGSDNTIYEADIVFNGVEFAWHTDFTNTDTGAYFVEGVALHEIGHFIGLNHSPVGGATMRYAGTPGISPQVGLSTDEITAARRLYPAAAGSYGSVGGTVTKGGSPIFSAAVYLQDATSNLFAGTVTESDGTYIADGLPPGNYTVFAAPLDPASADPFLCKGSSIVSDHAAADTTFLPTANVPVTVTASATSTVDFAVNGDTPAFRISRVRKPTANSFSYSVSSSPASMTVGQSNFYIGVLSTNLPTNNASLAITGDGLTLGSVIFTTKLFTNAALPDGYTAMSVPISISSNATPGMRTLIVQQGTNLAMTSGYLDILPASYDYNFDGLDDVFQRMFFSPFTSPQAAPGFDADGDGMTNGAEFVAGTVPTNAASRLAMLSPSNAAGGTTVRWQSVNGKRYQVSSRTNSAAGSWLNIGSPVTAAGSTAQFVDATATNGVRFYRVQVLP
jgi:Matrixin/Carboxypeptidase regulatory-like domain